jgi:phage-related tail protein
MQAAMHEASRAYAKAQEELSRLSQELSKAKQRLDELARPRLVGMGAMEKEMQRIEDYINRLKLARLLGQPAPMEAGLPANIKALERMLEILRLRWAVEFDPLLRQLELAARPPAKEITFEEALREIERTRETITSLEGQVALANAALEAQKRNMDALQEASWGLSQSIAAVRDLLAQEKEKRDLVIKGLQVALEWFLRDRDELIKTGKITEEEAARIDRNMMFLFETFTLTAEGKAVTTVNYIKWIVEELEKAVERAKAAAAGWQGAPVKGLQAGGRILQSGLAVVGERGPELVSLPRGAEVHPRSRLRSGSAGGGMLVVNFNGDIYGMDDFRERIREAVEYGKQRGWRT